MIRRLCLFTVVICLSAATSFADDPTKVADSHAAWLKVRAEHGGNYSYRVRWSSFAGFGHETTIVVADNKVIERRFREFNNRPVAPVPVRPGEKPAKQKDEGWVEKGDALGSHKHGAPAKTLDELYAEAAEIAKRDLADFERRYVRTDKNGLLLGCYIIDTRIADDAPLKGVSISTITMTEKEEGKPEPTVYRAPNGKAFPASWGAPPRIQTRDLRPLPGGYGRGSSTLANWIQKNLDAEK